MAIFKCKMCGGTLNVNEGMTVCECEYCGHKQKVPKKYQKNISIVEYYDDDDEYYEGDDYDEDNKKEIARKLKRGYDYIKIEDWSNARDFFWDIYYRAHNDDERAEAYLGMFLADNELKSLNELENTEFDNLLKEDNYKEAYLFGNKALKEKLKHYAKINADRSKEKDKLSEYDWAIRQMTVEPSRYTDYTRRHERNPELIEEERKNNYMRAKEYFDSHPDYKDSANISKECDELIAEWDKKTKLFESIKSTWNKGSYSNLKKAYNKFKSMDSYSPANEYIHKYEQMKHDIKRKIKSAVVFTIIFLIMYFLNFIIFYRKSEKVWNIMLVTVSIIATWSFVNFIICEGSFFIPFLLFEYDDFFILRDFRNSKI